jgi:hypothetical protein
MGARRRKLKRQAKRGSQSAAEALGWRVVSTAVKEVDEQPITNLKAKNKKATKKD